MGKEALLVVYVGIVQGTSVGKNIIENMLAGDTRGKFANLRNG